MKADDKYTFRMWLSNQLHLLAALIHEDFHTMEITTPQGDAITFSCYWQWTGSWPGGIGRWPAGAGDGWSDRCSCSEEDLR